MSTRIILALTGASGMPYAVALARALAATPDLTLHLIISRAATKVLALEAPEHAASLALLADHVHDQDDIAAGPASGSFRHQGMVVCPCSMHTLAAVAHGLGSNLIHRAADVTLKERRPLILVTRETPLHHGHIRAMLAASDSGAVIMPACPGFYANPRTIDELANHFAGRVLDQLGVEHHLSPRWGEEAGPQED